MVSEQITNWANPRPDLQISSENIAPKRKKPLLGSADFLYYYCCRNTNLSLISNSDVCDVIMWLPSNVIDPKRTTIYLRIAAAHFYDLGFRSQISSYYLGRHEEARRVIGEICRLNGRPAPKQDIIKWDSGEQQGISAVWAFPGMRRNLIILSLAWFRSVTGPFVREVGIYL